MLINVGRVGRGVRVKSVRPPRDVATRLPLSLRGPVTAFITVAAVSRCVLFNFKQLKVTRSMKSGVECVTFFFFLSVPTRGSLIRNMIDVITASDHVLKVRKAQVP